ncbi:MAG: Ribosomal RNA large subunit methyltransferase H [Candidatus Magasanikbacteria bacterium GW2011_GWC2_37_14]|uniref:Ribosomal RNA large subunit methyltransferase H n=1 Tax=Candidatus Magasanikbacteria bacterium GW2011_GWC2_37_14 TaxID=1619046 RepID=A0A0G0GND0_9BACT|nr:MAG: Ribosomal RNA large subunit methyltransferase H [Candidatus Magasanikbacteria bacterium GW2011_GWC2_37_14]
MKITLLVIGKLKEDYWRQAEAEYLKRLSAFVKLEIIELKEESFTEKDNPETIKTKEAKKLEEQLAKIKPDYLVAMNSTGKQFSSIKLSEQFNNVTIQQCNNVVFIIGGPLGLDKTILDHVNLILSLSNLTFTHQMARIILEEQIYRAFMIKENRKYHY